MKYETHINYYEVLGVAQTASADEIKRRYRELAKQHHPDRLLGLRAQYEAAEDEHKLREIEEQIEQAQHKMQQINVAYETLSDPAKRKRYDLFSWTRTRSRPSSTTSRSQSRAGTQSAASRQQAWKPPGARQQAQTRYTTRRADPPRRPPPRPRISRPHLLGYTVFAFVILRLCLLVVSSPTPVRPSRTNNPLVGSSNFQTLEANTATRSYELGVLMFDSSNFPAAIQFFSTAIRLNRTLADAYRYRGLSYHEIGDDGRALSDLQRFMTLRDNPTDLEVTSVIDELIAKDVEPIDDDPLREFRDILAGLDDATPVGE